MTNVADLSDPLVRKRLRKAGLLNAAGPVQHAYLTTADVKAAYAPRTGIQRSTTPMRRTPFRGRIKKTDHQEDGSFTLITPDGQTFAWPEMHLPEEPAKGWNRKVHVCFRWQVEDWLRDNGWWTWHCEMEMRSEPDIWDLYCLRERDMWLELKVRGLTGVANGLTPGQWEFGARLDRTGREHHVITWPDDWEKFKELAA
jgi:hypothetical protein